MDEQAFDPQEFADADEALQCVVAAVVGEHTEPWATVADWAKALRARRWLTAAVEYAQVRGWPDRPMMTRRQLLERGVGLQAVLAGRREALQNAERILCGPMTIHPYRRTEIQHSTYRYILGYPCIPRPVVGMAHELALLMNAERSAKEGEGEVRYE